MKRLGFACLFFFLSSASFLFCGIADHLKKIDAKTEGHNYGPIDFVYLINLDHRPTKWKECLEQLTPYGIRPFRFSAVNGWKIKHSALQEIGMRFKKNMRGGGMGTTFVWKNGKEYSSHELVGKEGTTYFCHCMARGAIGCLMSHVSILEDAYNSGYELIWVLEDDIEVLKNPIVIPKYIAELDRIVGRANWDLFYTDKDYRSKKGYLVVDGTDYRPDVDTRDQQRHNINRKISGNLRKMGSRFGTHSMIWTRHGMKKYLDYIKKHGVYLPIDMDVHLAPGIQIYSVLDDVVSNRLDALSDIGVNFSQATIVE